MRDRIASRVRVRRRELFLELNHDTSRTALVLGSGRSGTTWVAEAIARRHGSRLMFEPFHPRLGALAAEPRLLAPPEPAEPAARAIERVLAGRARSAHIDQLPVARLPRSRLVKDVHAANLLPWFRASYPAMPVLYVVRHPVAASLSRLESGAFYGLGDYLETPAGRAEAERSPAARWLPPYDRWRREAEPLVRLVAEWCIENAYPLGELEREGAEPVFYERIVADPVAELERLGELCEPALGPPARAPSAEEARRPSAMDWRGGAAAARRSGDWQRHIGRWTEQVPEALAARCREVVAEFGLDRLYEGGALPAGR